MNIYIWGDLEFADFVLKGISAMFDGGSHFNYAAAVLLVLFFMWSWIKWSLNPEKTPYPVKEFTFGLVFFLIFGGGTISPKFDVTLISERTGYATTVADVPLLAAVPSWLSTNFFREAAFVIRPFFTVPGYERLNHNDSDVNPLQALVRLSDLSNSILIDANLERTMKEYIATCYETYLNLDGAPITNSLDNLVSANLSTSLWDRLQTDITFLDSKKYLASGSVETGDCMNVHAYVKDQLDTAYKEKVEKLLQNNGIRDVDISAATGIITDQLSMGAIAPYTFATNLFVAATIKDGVAQSGMETWANKMVFEASRKRTYEAAGNANMFMRIYIPTITAIEMFSFFIAPVMMILSVMGGIGFSMVGKYLMLVLFINMWGFIKVFVDLYTTLSIKKAFDAVDLATSNPFLFKTYAETFLQVEDWIAVSSNLTNAIPFFAMFLLYGGVHSMMGVMRSVNTGSVDPSNTAPTIATAPNNGVFQQGDYQVTYNTAGGYAYATQSEGTMRGLNTISGSNVASASSAAINAGVRSEQVAATQQFVSALTQSTSFNNQWSQLQSGTASHDFSTMNSEQRIATLAHALSNKLDISQDEAVERVMQMAAEGGGTVRFGANAVSVFSAGANIGVKGSLAASGKQGTAERIQQSKDALNQWATSQSGGKAIKNSETLTDTSSSGQSGSDTRGFAETYQSLDALVNTSQLSTTAQHTQQASANFLRSWSLSHASEPVLKNSFDRIAERFNDLHPSQKIDQAEALMASNGYAGNALLNVTNGLFRNARSYDDTVNAFNQASDLWKIAASTAKDPAINAQLLGISEHFSDTARNLVLRDPEYKDTFSTKEHGNQVKAVNANQQPTSRQEVELLNQLGNDQSQSNVARTGASINTQASSIAQPGSAPQDVVTDTAKAAQQAEQAKADFEEGRYARSRGFNAIGNIQEGLGNIVRDIFGPGVRYGANAAEDGKVFQAAAYNMKNEDGGRLTSSTDVDSGMEKLLSFDTAQMSHAFNSNRVNRDVLAMNDALAVLKSPAIDQNGEYIKDENGKPITVGQMYISSFTNPEELKAFTANIGRFEEFKSKLSPENIQALDTLTELKSNGQITNVNANNIAQRLSNDNTSTVDTINSNARASYAEVELITSKQIPQAQKELLMGALEQSGYDRQFENYSPETSGGHINQQFDIRDRTIAYNTLAESTMIFQQGFAENNVAQAMVKGTTNEDVNERERIRGQFYTNIDVMDTIKDTSDTRIQDKALSHAYSAYSDAVNKDLNDKQLFPLLADAGVYSETATLMNQRTSGSYGDKLTLYVDSFTNSEPGKNLYDSPEKFANYMAAGTDSITKKN